MAPEPEILFLQGSLPLFLAGFLALFVFAGIGTPPRPVRPAACRPL